MGLSRDTPAFFSCVLISVFFMLYSHVGVLDYYPAAETARMETYPLLACGIATFAMRPKEKFARWGLACSVGLSLETIWILFCRGGRVFGLGYEWANAVPAGYYNCVKLASRLGHSIGFSNYIGEPIAYLVSTFVVFGLCARAFSFSYLGGQLVAFTVSIIWMMMIGYLLAFSVAILNSVSGFEPMIFMVLHSALFWHILSWRSKRREQNHKVEPVQ